MISDAVVIAECDCCGDTAQIPLEAGARGNYHYDEERVRAVLASNGWVASGDQDYCSPDCATHRAPITATVLSEEK